MRCRAPHPAGWDIEDPAGVLEISDQELSVAAGATDDAYVLYLMDDDHPPGPGTDVYDSDRSHLDSSTTGTGCGMILRPPPRSPQEMSATFPDDPGQVLYAAGSRHHAGSLQAQLRRVGEELRVKIRAIDNDDLWIESPWVDIPDLPVRLDFEYDFPRYDEEIVRLRIDGEIVATIDQIEGGSPPDHLEEHRVGVMEPGIDSIGLRIDDIDMSRYRMHAEEEPMQTDDFEDGTFPGWETPFGSALTLVERHVAGGHWLEADVASGNSFLVDSTPKAALRARLRFDLDSAELPENSVKIAALHSNDTFSFDDEHLFVRVRRTAAAGAQLKVRVKDEVWHDTGWQPLPENTVNLHHVELTFQAASEPGAADGEVRVWLDGVEVSGVSGSPMPSTLSRPCASASWVPAPAARARSTSTTINFGFPTRRSLEIRKR